MDEEKRIVITNLKNKFFLFLLNQNRIFSIFPFDLNKSSNLNNIYIGKVQKISSNIQSAFVEYEKGSLGFLPLEDSNYFYPNLKTGDEIVVQICREKVANKLPKLTTIIQFEGSYCVLKKAKRNPSIYFSKNINMDQKEELKNVFKLKNMENTIQFDCIIRSSVNNLSDYNPVYDEIENLIKEFDKLLKKAQYLKCFQCINQNTIPKWLQELESISKNNTYDIITDSLEIYNQLKTNFSKECLSLNVNFTYYEDKSYSLNLLYGIQSKLEHALNRRIWLKSGAYLIIDYTEAFTVFDVNSGKIDIKKDKTEASLIINKEAAKEIALQLQLRNLSGIILIDFINMSDKKMEQDLLDFMTSLVSLDKIKTQVIDITPLGIMEITRKKIRKPLYEELGDFTI